MILASAQPPSVDDSMSGLWHGLILPGIGGVGLLVLVLALWAGVCWWIDSMHMKSKGRVRQYEETTHPRIVRPPRR